MGAFDWSKSFQYINPFFKLITMVFLIYFYDHKDKQVTKMSKSILRVHTRTRTVLYSFLHLSCIQLHCLFDLLYPKCLDWLSDKQHCHTLCLNDWPTLKGGLSLKININIIINTWSYSPVIIYIVPKSSKIILKRSVIKRFLAWKQ